ncbi:MAG: hypothetical protein A2945_04670 [Candidatus Liptonbacteria bacterium RIFCSPLOWO2_01_FULL_52_25]|uniref:Uncharacterized protein n=1 Tax=Candidatus Liptonbacteria bacterium RIFCSPLOWO2_01_FULL_52_25 TaxID=1798650 RepID=A0A1G2CDD4_9BACT|nr:MAG: hypothetical protein A2945_04670 [Candidatus Liptonbacteria bacterium RIFCSPLOWO2_01_FULL_52_25]
MGSAGCSRTNADFTRINADNKNPRACAGVINTLVAVEGFRLVFKTYCLGGYELYDVLSCEAGVANAADGQFLFSIGPRQD